MKNLKTKRVTSLLLFSTCWILFTSCSNIKAKYDGFSASASIQLVEDDMKRWLNEIPGTKNLNYLFCVDKSITDGSFGYEIKQNQVRLIGGDEIGATHGLYFTRGFGVYF